MPLLRQCDRGCQNSALVEACEDGKENVVSFVNGLSSYFNEYCVLCFSPQIFAPFLVPHECVYREFLPNRYPLLEFQEILDVNYTPHSEELIHLPNDVLTWSTTEPAINLGVKNNSDKILLFFVFLNAVIVF